MRAARPAFALMLLAVVPGCGGSPSPSATQIPHVTSTLTATGSVGSQFAISPIDPPMGNEYMVEQSEVWTPNGLMLFYDPSWNGAFNSLLWNSSIGQWTNITAVDTGMRFPYVVDHEYNGQLLAFYLNTSNGNIYLKVSTDNGATWPIANGGNPVLTKSSDPNSIYYTLWNVGVALATDGTAHLVVECQDGNHSGQTAVGLGYSYGMYNSTTKTLSFDANRTATQVVVGGGNPYLWVNGTGSGADLVSIHGLLNQSDSPYWMVTASVRKNGVWTTRRDLLQIAQQNIHVADPSGFSYTSNAADTAIAFSSNQFGTKVAKAPVPFATFMSSLLN
jgi:hypothetical protein